MKTFRNFFIFAVSFFAAHTARECVAQPKAPNVPNDLASQIEIAQPGVKLTLLAEHPDLVTPTGIDVGDDGRIWLAACHTHFRPQDYVGPEHDEILVFDKDGTNRQMFYNKTDATMHVELGPDGWVYLAERDRILRVKDSDGDGVGDTEENIAVLDTVADYPHNGLSGMAWHSDGGLIFSLGENFGKDWVLTARDGSKVNGRGEGGVFWCSADGKNLRRIARGFWNPFGLVVRSDGEIFAAENDPGSRPPCRLLNVVEGADYGFQWVYGSAPIHPFVAWNGELRGTLGMIHPCGEGPSAIVELGGGVVVPSWSNHCIDFFPLHRQGAGFRSERVEIVRGGENFRPVCMAPGPDGAFYVTDWVFSSYELHSRGRLWKLEIDQASAPWLQSEREPMNDAASLAQELRQGTSTIPQARLFELAQGSDPYLSDAALTALAKHSTTWTEDSVRKLKHNDRVWALVALRRVDLDDERWVRAFIKDPDPQIRFECLRWIADAVLVNFKPQVEALLNDQKLDYQNFEAALATWNTLQGNPGAGVTDANVLIERIQNAAISAQLRAFALRLAPPTDPRLTMPLLRQLMDTGNALLASEVVRTLSAQRSKEASDFLASIASDESASDELRAEAASGLESSGETEHVKLLIGLATNPSKPIRDEALRSLRGRVLEDDGQQALKKSKQDHADSAKLADAVLRPDNINAGRPRLDDIDAWTDRLKSLANKPDVQSGRRIFFHSKIALCATCHRHDGRGNVVGTDLTLLSRQGDAKSILQSILQPNLNVAPQFYTTLLELDDGSVFSGILLRSSSVDVFRDSVGNERTFQKSQIVQRKERKTSLMPTGLMEQLTDQEIADLLAFLTTDPMAHRP
jgi:putative membrane-bound dehydrogenase-like protein